jgi:ABC-type multidrug transport system fused ATPase/permease subunit
MKLSGGQRQRIAIARSIISKPKILILDEATSAIDVRGEQIVQAALEKASKGRTTITIAHRLSTIKKADQIVVLQRGRVVEQGTHETLLENTEGAYYGLVHAQKLSMDDTGEEVVYEGNPILDREKSNIQQDTASSPTESKGRGKNLFRGLGRLLYEQRKCFPLYAIAILFSGAAGASVPLQAYLFGQVTVVFREIGQQLLDDSTFWCKIWAAVAVGIGFSYFVAVGVATTVENFISSVYRQEYFESILLQRSSYFDQEDNSTGQLTARLSTDPTALKEILGLNFCLMLVGVFSLIGALAISFAYGWKLAVVSLCVTVPLNVISGFYRVRYELQFNEMNEAVFSESSKFGAESISAFRTVSALVMEDNICSRYNTLLQEHVVSAYKKARLTTIVFAFSDSISIACQALILWYGGHLLSTGEYQVIQFFITFMAVMYGGEFAAVWLSFGPNIVQATTAANRILGVRESRNKDDASSSTSVPDAEGGVKIQFENVYFKYPTRDVSIFKNLNITIEKGQFAALVGASGSGKTSIVSLLERFYDIAKGNILFNGKNIYDINVHDYRKLLSLVAQEPFLFSGTIRENILLGVNPDEITEEQIHQCCRDANIHDFIISLPDGYNTNIGSKGVTLSGGQKQRVSIARALIRNPRLLLLDEATSSLDSESEKLVQAAFERVAKGRTTIAVAHRLATIQNADIIYVLGEGKVLEKGTHAELLRLKGMYWHMVSLSLDILLVSICEYLLGNTSVKTRPSIDRCILAVQVHLHSVPVLNSSLNPLEMPRKSLRHACDDQEYIFSSLNMVISWSLRISRSCRTSTMMCRYILQHHGSYTKVAYFPATCELISLTALFLV